MPSNHASVRVGFIKVLLFAGSLLSFAGITDRVKAQSMYTPVDVVSSEVISDVLSEDDIPTGEGGFARDYRVELSGGEQVAIDLSSDQFDTLVKLIAADGTTVAENDDAPDGSTNSLLFVRIPEEESSGQYIVRVRSFGETGEGTFNLKITRLCECVD